ncbi:MAG TPA: DUF4342 domain-containing protein [Crinalium sp.]|jgi:hypothetical protein
MTDLQDQTPTVEDTLHTPDVLPTEIPASTDTPPREDVRVEEYKITGDALVTKVKELIHEGNIRRIVIKTEEGNTLIEIPLTVGVVGGVVATSLFPVVAALGAIGALVAHLTIVIEKKV